MEWWSGLGCGQVNDSRRGFSAGAALAAQGDKPACAAGHRPVEETGMRQPGDRQPLVAAQFQQVAGGTAGSTPFEVTITTGSPLWVPEAKEGNDAPADWRWV